MQNATDHYTVVMCRDVDGCPMEIGGNKAMV